MTGIALLGSTGSIGRSTMDVLRTHRQHFRLIGISGHSNIDLLRSQEAEFAPSLVAVTSPPPHPPPHPTPHPTAHHPPHHPPHPAHTSQQQPIPSHWLTGADATLAIVRHPDVHTVVAATSGISSLPAIFEAARLGKRIALANKESLVAAGPLLMATVKSSGATLIPVDSEHSAVFQALMAGRRQDVARVILTASGGPLRTWSLDQLAHATIDQALAHPTWKMGQKITLDSSTLFNKALEYIEAHVLFDLPASQIDVVIHPQSIVHSMVEYLDGSVIAQLSPPDMRTPIQYALTYPQRIACPSPKMNFTKAQSLTFEPPDETRFPAVALARTAVQQGPLACLTLNSANEVAAHAYLSGQINFLDIAKVVAQTMQHINLPEARHVFSSLDNVLAADATARKLAHSFVTSASQTK